MNNFFLPYQVKWINSNDRYLIHSKSRQIGLSFAEAFWSFRRRIRVKQDHLFCSSNYKTAKEFINYVKQFAEATNIGLGYELLDKDAFQSEAVIFPNGSRIMIVSSNPTALRGFRADVTLDEFAFHDNQEGLLTAATPVTTWGEGKLRIISTHNGEGTVFNTLLKDAEAGKNAYKVFRTSIHDALNDGLCEKIPGEHRKIKDTIERRKTYLEHIRSTCLNSKMFEQEYECKVLGTSSIISHEEYTKCIIPNFNVSRDKLTDISKASPIYVGIDVGRHNDNTVIWMIEEGNDPSQINPKLKRVFRTLLVRTLKQTSYQDQYEIICSLINNSKVRKVLIECNGIGAGLAEQLENNFPDKCHAWTTSSSNKATAVERFAGWVAQNRIALPVDKDIMEDILAMQRTISSTGKIAYEGHTATSHCDAFIAASLALEAGTGDQSFFSFSKV